MFWKPLEDRQVQECVIRLGDDEEEIHPVKVGRDLQRTINAYGEVKVNWCCSDGDEVDGGLGREGTSRRWYPAQLDWGKRLSFLIRRLAYASFLLRL